MSVIIEVLRRPLEPGQYASGEYILRLEEAGALISMASVGNPYENARAESFFRTLNGLGGADAVITTAVSPKAFEQGFGSLKRGGTLVFVGLPKDNNIQLPIFETVLNGIHVVGSIVGTRLDLQEVFELHAMGRTRVVHEERNLDEVNEAIEEVEEGKVDARLVFDMGVEEPARQHEGVLTQEAEAPSEQPTGEVGEHRGPVPG